MRDLKTRLKQLHANAQANCDMASAVDTGAAYGVIDSRGLQPGEVIAKINQRGVLIDVFYDPATRNARPICR